MNKIIVAGHLGADPSLRESTNREKYCHFSLATDEYRRDAKGELHKRTEWHSVFFWGTSGETLARIVKKGSRLLVDGRLESRPDPDAGAAPRRLWSIKGLTYELLDRRPDTAPEGTGTGSIDEEAASDDVPL